MILLDTNVVSEALRPVPDARVIDWFRSQLVTSLFLCAPVLAELRYGVERLPTGRRRDVLKVAIDRIETVGYRDRILPFDTAAAAEFGRLAVKRERHGRRMEPIDVAIAAIAVVHGATLATRDIKDFADLGFDVIDPFNLGAD
jgi:predicted nucleic acid-binding protein